MVSFFKTVYFDSLLAKICSWFVVSAKVLPETSFCLSNRGTSLLAWASAEIFPGQNRHFAYPFQVVDDATQVDVHKTLYPFYTTKKMLNFTATVANCFSSTKILHWANVCFNEHGYFKTELAEFWMNYKLWIIRTSIKSYQNTSKVRV